VSLPLFMDVHVQRQITVGLRLRGIDVLTAQEDGSETWKTHHYWKELLSCNDRFSRAMMISRWKPRDGLDKDYLLRP